MVNPELVQAGKRKVSSLRVMFRYSKPEDLRFCTLYSTGISLKEKRIRLFDPSSPDLPILCLPQRTQSSKPELRPVKPPPHQPIL